MNNDKELDILEFKEEIARKLKLDFEKDIFEIVDETSNIIDENTKILEFDTNIRLNELDTSQKSNLNPIKCYYISIRDKEDYDNYSYIIYDNLEEAKEKYDYLINTKHYDFLIVLKTNTPNSDEFKKLTHHIEYLVDINNSKYPLSFYDVNVKAIDGYVEVTGVTSITFENKDKVSNSKIEDLLYDVINEDGWQDLDVKLISVNVKSSDENLEEEQDEYEEE